MLRVINNNFDQPENEGTMYKPSADDHSCIGLVSDRDRSIVRVAALPHSWLFVVITVIQNDVQYSLSDSLKLAQRK